MAIVEKSAPGQTRISEAAPAGHQARLQEVRVMISMELGRTQKTVSEVLDIGEQSLIELDKSAGEPVNIMVNGRLYARGEVVTVGENFGVRVTEILGQEPGGK